MNAPKKHKKHRVLIAVAVIFAVISAALTIWIVQQLRHDAQEQARVHQIISMQEEMLSSLIDIENGQRGFLLTQDPRFLEPYNNAILKLDQQYQQLSSLTKNPALQELLRELKPLIDKRADLVEVIIQYERDGESGLALETVIGGLGKQYMDEIRMLIADFKQKQLGILKNKSEEFESTIQVLTFAISMAFFLAVATSLALFARISRLRDDSEDKLSFSNALLRSAEIGIVSTDTNFVITSANPAAESLFRFSSSHVLGRENLGSIIQRLNNVTVKNLNGEDEEPIHDDLLKLLDDKLDTLNFSGSYGQDGERSTQISCAITKAKDNHSNTVGYVLLASDISAIYRAKIELKQSEQLYKKSTEHLKNIIDSSIDVICTIDNEGRFVEVGAASTLAWGYSPEELIGKKYIDLVHPDDRIRTNHVAEEIVRGNPTKSFKNRYIKKDGQVAHMMWSAVWSERDQLMYAIARDETEAIKISEELKATEALLELAGDISKVGGWTLDIKTEKLLWTPQVNKILEFPEDVSLTLDQRLKFYTEESRKDFLNAIDRCKSAGDAFDIQLETRTNLGKLIFTRLIGQPVKNEEGEVVAITGAVQEITEQKHMERALITAKENAISANASKDIFLSTMSHEIRTPLNGMLGMLELLSYSTLNAEQKDMLFTAAESGKNLVRIINDLLDHSKIEAGKCRLSMR